MEEEKVISTQDSLTPSATVHELSDSVMTGKADFSKTKMFTLAIAAGAFIAFGALLISVFSFSEFTEMEMELLFSKYGLLYLYEPSI